jgi:hypothetical protein
VFVAESADAAVAESTLLSPGPRFSLPSPGDSTLSLVTWAPGLRGDAVNRKNLLRWGGALAGIGIAALELRLVPLVFVVAFVLVGGAAVWLRWRSSQQGTHGRDGGKRTLTLLVLSSLGLWAGLYVVLNVADTGGDAGATVLIPVRTDGQELPPFPIMVHGLLSSAGTVGLLLPLILPRGRTRRFIKKNVAESRNGV